MDAVLHGNLGTILEWTGAGNGKTDIPSPEMSVSAVAGAGFMAKKHGFPLARE